MELQPGSVTTGRLQFIRQCNTFIFGHDDEWQSAALTLSHGDNNAALACLVAFQAAVLAVFFGVFRADMTTGRLLRNGQN